ncbi:MAG: hypothetical protein HY712_06870 [candidate division NC10 bacterium]|nr:hypothetical protein [candidate division NC10 bacterium]
METMRTFQGWAHRFGGGMALVVMLVVTGTALCAEAGYLRDSGQLPTKKAEADAARMVEIIKRFQQERLKGNCVQTYDRQGLTRLYDLKDEEGRGTSPPRSGYEVELYKRIKEALARGEKLDNDRLLELSLGASVDSQGEVNLQDVFLTLHNVTRLLARPETWWTDHNYVPGVVYDLPVVGGGEITRGRWVPGWRGMQNDSIFPSVKDIFGHEPAEGAGSGKKTLAELAGEIGNEKAMTQHRREQIEKKRQNLAKKFEEKKALLAELEQKLATESNATEKRLLAERIGFLRNEIAQPDISQNVLNPKYTADLFGVNEDGSGTGLFKPLYGAQDTLGNGGNYYYFWLGALARAYAGYGAQAGGAEYETWQKWMGSEEEYARGQVQVSHFNGGGTLGALANQASADCAQAKKPPEPIESGTVQLVPPPPPPVEKQNDDYLNCLCRSCGGMLGGYFTTDPSSECNGGCTCWGPLTGWCTPVPVGAQQSKACTASAFGVADPGAGLINRGIEIARGMNRRAMEEAIRSLRAAKKLDEAVGVAERARKADPGLTSPVFGELSALTKRAGWDDVYYRNFPAAIPHLEQAVSLNPGDSDAARKLADAKRFAKVWPQVEARAREFDKQMGEKKLWTAHRTMLEMQDLQFEMTGGMANPLSKRVMDDFHKGIAEYNAFWQEKTALHTKYFQEWNWEAMLSSAEDSFRRELHPANLAEARSRVQFAQGMLGQQKAAMDYYGQTRAAFEQGKVSDVPAAARELRNLTSRFTPQDGRRQQILDLVGAMETRQRAIQAKAYAVNFFFQGDSYYRGHQYADAGRLYFEGLKAIRDNGDISDPDYGKYYALWQDAQAKEQRIRLLLPGVAQVAMEPAIAPRATLNRAVAEADEILRLQPNNSDTQIYKNRLLWKQQQISTQEERAAMARQLWVEGEQLQQQNRLLEAVAKYHQSLALLPDPQLTRHVQALEERIARARQLRADGERLQGQSRIAEAIGKFRESLGLVADAPLSRHVQALEYQMAQEAQRREQATGLWNEGRDLLNVLKPVPALRKFKESLALWRDETRAAYVRDLERRQAQGMRLRDEGVAHQQAQRFREAIGKYRESLAAWPDPDLEAHVRQLEASLAPAQIGPSTPNPPVNPPVASAGPFAGDWKSENRPEGEAVFFSLTQSGSRVTGTYRVEVKISSGSGGKKWALTGRIEGTASGNRMTGSYRDEDDKKPTGRIECTMAPDGNSMAVVVQSDGDTERWTARRVGGSGVTAGASTPSSSTTAASASVVAEITNRSRENVHICLEGESFGPENRIAPGETRSVRVAIPQGGRITFKAGRDGSTLASKTWQGDPGSPNRVPVVIFDDSNPSDKLIVSTGLR